MLLKVYRGILGLIEACFCCEEAIDSARRRAVLCERVRGCCV